MRAQSTLNSNSQFQSMVEHAEQFDIQGHQMPIFFFSLCMCEFIWLFSHSQLACRSFTHPWRVCNVHRAKRTAPTKLPNLVLSLHKIVECHTHTHTSIQITHIHGLIQNSILWIFYVISISWRLQTILWLLTLKIPPKKKKRVLLRNCDFFFSFVWFFEQININSVSLSPWKTTEIFTSTMIIITFDTL